MDANFRELLKVEFSRLKRSQIVGTDKDTPIDNNAAAFNKIFAVKTFMNYPKTAKFAKVFTHKGFPLYSISRVSARQGSTLHTLGKGLSGGNITDTNRTITTFYFDLVKQYRETVHAHKSMWSLLAQLQLSIFTQKKTGVLFC